MKHDPNQGSLFGTDPQNPAPVPVPPERAAQELPGQQFLPITPLQAADAQRQEQERIDVLAEAARILELTKPLVVRIDRWELLVTCWRNKDDGRRAWWWAIRQHGCQVSEVWTRQDFETRDEAKADGLPVLELVAQRGAALVCFECGVAWGCSCEQVYFDVPPCQRCRCDREGYAAYDETGRLLCAPCADDVGAA